MQNTRRRRGRKLMGRVALNSGRVPRSSPLTGSPSSHIAGLEWDVFAPEPPQPLPMACGLHGFLSQFFCLLSFQTASHVCLCRREALSLPWQQLFPFTFFFSDLAHASNCHIRSAPTKVSLKAVKSQTSVSVLGFIHHPPQGHGSPCEEDTARHGLA